MLLSTWKIPFSTHHFINMHVETMENYGQIEPILINFSGRPYFV